MSFTIGQKVAYLYEKGTGIITSIQGKQITVEDENGFDNVYNASDLVVIHSETYNSEVSFEDVKPSEDPHYRVLEGVRTGQRKKMLYGKSICTSKKSLIHTPI